MNILNPDRSLTYEWAGFAIATVALFYIGALVASMRRDKRCESKLEALRATGAIDFLAKLMRLHEVVGALEYSGATSRATSGTVRLLVVDNDTAVSETSRTSEEFDGVICGEEVLAYFDGARATVFVLHVDTRDALHKAGEWLNTDGHHFFRGKRVPVSVELVRQ